MATWDYECLRSHLKGFLFHFKVSRPHGGPGRQKRSAIIVTNYTGFWLASLHLLVGGRNCLVGSVLGTTLAGRPTALHQPSARTPGGGHGAWLNCPHPRAETALPSALAPRFMSGSLPAATWDCLVSDSRQPTSKPHFLVARKEPAITFKAGGIFPAAGKITQHEGHSPPCTRLTEHP